MMRRTVYSTVVVFLITLFIGGMAQALADTGHFLSASEATAQEDQLRLADPFVFEAGGALQPSGAVLVDSFPNYATSGSVGSITFDGTNYWVVRGGSSTGTAAMLTSSFALVTTATLNLDCRAIVYSPFTDEVYIKGYTLNGLFRLNRTPFDGTIDTLYDSLFQNNQSKIGLSEDGRQIYDVYDGKVRVYDLSTGAILDSFYLDLHHDITVWPRTAQIAHTGDHLLTIAGDHVFTYHPTTGGFNDSIQLPLTATMQEWSFSFANGLVFLKGGALGWWYAYRPFLAGYVGPALDTLAPVRLPAVVGSRGVAAVDSGKAFYRLSGAPSYTVAAMLSGPGADQMQYELPASGMGARGFEFYFELYSNPMTARAGNPETPLAVVSAVTNAQGQRPTALPDASYRMVSLPIDPVGLTNVTAVYADDLGNSDGGRQWRMFRHDAALDNLREYPSLPDVTPERAYWLTARGAKRYGVEGYSRRPNRMVNGLNYYEVSLDSGWNQLANPLPFTVSLLDILLDTNGVIVGGVPFPDNLLSDTAYLYDGAAYQSVTTVPAWQGVFVEARQTGMKILVRYREASPPPAVRVAPPAATPSSEHWTVCLRLDGDRTYDDGNFIGVRADAERGRDRYDYSEPPPAPEGAQLAFRLPEGDDTKLKRSDYRPPFTEGESWQVEFSQAVNQRLTVSGIAQLPAGMEAVLILEDGHAFTLHEGSVVDLPDDATSGRLVVGTSDFAAQERESVRPDAYELYQNFPNPFNPSTSIRFSLPEAADVSLAIYNVLGQQVRVLTDRHFDAGTHDLVWDGRDERGQSVASGVYFYRLVTPAFVDDRRMVFLK